MDTWSGAEQLVASKEMQAGIQTGNLRGSFQDHIAHRDGLLVGRGKSWDPTVEQRFTRALSLQGTFAFVGKKQHTATYSTTMANNDDIFYFICKSLSISTTSRTATDSWSGEEKSVASTTTAKARAASWCAMRRGFSPSGTVRMCSF